MAVFGNRERCHHDVAHGEPRDSTQNQSHADNHQVLGAEKLSHLTAPQP